MSGVHSTACSSGGQVLSVRASDVGVQRLPAELDRESGVSVRTDRPLRATIAIAAAATEVNRLLITASSIT